MTNSSLAKEANSAQPFDSWEIRDNPETQIFFLSFESVWKLKTKSFNSTTTEQDQYADEDHVMWLKATASCLMFGEALLDAPMFPNIPDMSGWIFENDQKTWNKQVFLKLAKCGENYECFFFLHLVSVWVLECFHYSVHPLDFQQSLGGVFPERMMGVSDSPSPPSCMT